MDMDGVYAEDIHLGRKQCRQRYQSLTLCFPLTVSSKKMTTKVDDNGGDGDSSILAADIQKADELWQHAEAQVPSDHTPVYNFLKDLDNDAKHADNVHVKWRLARACKDMSEQTSNVSTTRAKQYAYEGKEVATRAVELDPTVWEVQMFRGVLLGVCSRFEIFHKLASAREMKDCFQAACELAGDTSPEPYHSLGQALFGFAEAGRAARLLGLKGTYQDALEMFQKAESLCPHACYARHGGHYNRNWLMIVKALKATGRMEEAREWLKKLLDAEVRTPDDRTTLAEAQTIKI